MHNGNGKKPRKGSFEVVLITESTDKKDVKAKAAAKAASEGPTGKLIFSKLDTHGPSKSRAALPDPVEFLAVITEAISA